MKKKISLAPVQNINELLALKKIKHKVHFLPLDYGSLLYCKNNYLRHINPIDYLNNEIHKKGIQNHFQIRKELKKILKFHNQYKSILFVQGYSLNAYYLVRSLIDAIKLTYKIDRIYLSGWRQTFGGAEKEHFYSLSDIFSCFKKIKLVFVLNKKKHNPEEKIYSFVESQIATSSRKTVFFTDTGYNFRKIIYQFIKSGYHCIILARSRVNFFKSFFLRMLRVRFIYLKKNQQVKSYSNKIKIKLSKKFKFCENFLEIIANNYLSTANTLNEKCKAIKKIINNFELKQVIINHTQSYNPFLIKICNKKRIPVTLIGHGTISKGHNRYEKMYQDIISKGIYSPEVKTYPIQSRIINEYLKFKRNSNHPKGNIIFSQIKKKKPQFILYAVTIKKFSNFVYYGQELFYEYFHNLEFLNNLAQEKNLNICVKHHPGYLDTNKESSDYFKNLTFLEDPLYKILKNTEILISFSSSSIEDALSSKIPVVLFDPWKRYKHCAAETNLNKKNKCLYYVNKNKNLIKAINVIKNSSNISFKRYIYSTKVNTNIKRLIYEQN